MTLVNDSDQPITLSTDPEDAAAEVVIAAGTIFTIQAIMVGGATAIRFTSGAPAFYLKTPSGDGTGAYLVWA